MAGGDGTFHVAINHTDLESNTFSLWPLGSGNDFVKNFPKLNMQVLIENIKAQKINHIDLLQVNDIYAHTISGTGFEALVAEKAHLSKIRWAAMKYILPVARHLFTYKPQEMHIAADAFEYNGPVFMLSAGNGKWAGGGFKLFPNASVNDGKLDLLLIKPPGFFQRILYVWLVNWGRHSRLSIVHQAQVEKCTVTFNNLQTFEADGDIYKTEKLQIEVKKGILQYI